MSRRNARTGQMAGGRVRRKYDSVQRLGGWGSEKVSGRSGGEEGEEGGGRPGQIGNHISEGGGGGGVPGLRGGKRRLGLT